MQVRRRSIVLSKEAGFMEHYGSEWHRMKRYLVRLGPVAALLGLMLVNVGCSTTEQQQPNIIAKAQGAETPVPAFSGFLGYYGRLQPGGPGQALYRYVNANANWSQYNAIIVEPVSFWDSEDSSVDPEEQQLLCAYFTNQVKQDLVKY